MPEKPQQSAEEEALLEPVAAQELEAENLESENLETENLESENLETENLESEAENHNASSLIQNLETQDFESDLRELDSEEVDSEELISEEEEPSKETFVFAPPVEEEPHSRVALSDNKSGLGMGWYVVHTYSGYENKVKANIEKAIENRHLENEILEVRVPLQDVMELKNGVEKTTQKKMFPGYVLLHMDADNNDAWYVVRNTRGVTGFVGPGSKPVPLTEAELKALDFGVDTAVEFAEGDVISVTAGVWKDTVGTVQKIDAARQTVTINVEMFGRETPVEINFTDVKKMWD
ncbi:MAG: transcription termination/antitermination protein NusG [Lachnospiraceae bacterium]